MKKNKTAMAMSVAVLTLVLMGTACNNNTNRNNTNVTPPASPSLSASPSEVTETEGTSAAVLEATGVYEGLQDNNSIEITTDAGPTAFQITPEIRDQVSPWDSGTPVKYSYSEAVVDAEGENTQRPTIITIEKQ
jgi:hypothetical protein